MDISQMGIIVFGPLAIFLVSCKTLKYRKWGYVAGLLSQPFWFWTAIDNRQWAVLAVSGIYTLSWIHGIFNFWFTHKNI